MNTKQDRQDLEASSIAREVAREPSGVHAGSPAQGCRAGDSWGVDVSLFLGITFGIAWSLVALVLLFPDWFQAWFGPMGSRSPAFYLAVWSPNIAALIVVATRAGRQGLRELLGRLTRWRAPAWVWITAIAFYPALMLVVQVVGLALGRPFSGVDVWLVAMAAALLSLPALALGPLGEELGWRGYLLPRVLERFTPAAAAMIVGAFWMLWHLPAFFIAGLPQDGMVLSMFLVGGMALSVFVTWLFVHSGQSVLIGGIIPHAMVNAYGDATGDMTWLQVVVMASIALLLMAALGAHLGAKPQCPRDAAERSRLVQADP